MSERADGRAMGAKVKEEVLRHKTFWRGEEEAGAGYCGAGDIGGGGVL